MSISRVMAEGIATHRALKLVGCVCHHMMAAATAAQAKMRSTVLEAPIVGENSIGHQNSGKSFGDDKIADHWATARLDACPAVWRTL